MSSSNKRARDGNAITVIDDDDDNNGKVLIVIDDDSDEEEDQQLIQKKLRKTEGNTMPPSLKRSITTMSSSSSATQRSSSSSTSKSSLTRSNSSGSAKASSSMTSSPSKLKSSSSTSSMTTAKSKQPSIQVLMKKQQEKQAATVKTGPISVPAKKTPTMASSLPPLPQKPTTASATNGNSKTITTIQKKPVSEKPSAVTAPVAAPKPKVKELTPVKSTRQTSDPDEAPRRKVPRMKPSGNEMEATVSSSSSSSSSSSKATVTDIIVANKFQDFLLATNSKNGFLPLLHYLVPEASVASVPWYHVIIEASQALRMLPSSLARAIRDVLSSNPTKCGSLTSILGKLYEQRSDEDDDRSILSCHPSNLTNRKKQLLRHIIVEEMKKSFKDDEVRAIADEPIPDDEDVVTAECSFKSSLAYSNAFLPLVLLEVEAQLKSEMNIDSQGVSVVLPHPSGLRDLSVSAGSTFDDFGNSKKGKVNANSSVSDSNAKGSDDVVDCVLRFSYTYDAKKRDRAPNWDDMREIAKKSESQLFASSRRSSSAPQTGDIRDIDRSCGASELKAGDFCILSMHTDSLGRIANRNSSAAASTNSGPPNPYKQNQLIRKQIRVLFPCLVHGTPSFNVDEKLELAITMDIRAYVPRAFVRKLVASSEGSNSKKSAVLDVPFFMWKGPNLITSWREYDAIVTMVSKGSSRVPLAKTVIPGKSPSGGGSSSGNGSGRSGGMSTIHPKLRQYLGNKYNENQREALYSTISDSSDTTLSLILGPPGTGKTNTIVGILNLLHASASHQGVRQRWDKFNKDMRMDKKITDPKVFRGCYPSEWTESIYKPLSKTLVCAPSNAAVDGIITRMIVKAFVNEDVTKKFHPNFVRIGRRGGGYNSSRNEDDSSKKDDLLGRQGSILDSRAAARGIDDHIEWMLDIFQSDQSGVRKEFESKKAEIAAEKDKEMEIFNKLVQANKDKLKLQQGKSDSSNGELKILSDTEYEDLLKQFMGAGSRVAALENDAQLLHVIMNGSFRSDDEGEKSSKPPKQGNFGQRKRLIKQVLMDRADIVFSTLSGSALINRQQQRNSGDEKELMFDTVIIDEAAQATEPSVIIPLCYGVKKCVLVGDPNQLPATVLSEEASRGGLQRSLFERLQECGYKTHLLNVQYRCHPTISKYFSTRFYDGKVKDADESSSKSNESSSNGMEVEGAEKAAAKKNPAPKSTPFFHSYPCFGPFVFFDVAKGIEDRSTSLSYSNREEAKLAVNLFKTLDRLCEDGHRTKLSIAIITPYAEQLAEIRSHLRRSTGSSSVDNLEVNTVDGFQGREVDVVIFSCVRASSSQNSRSIGFLNDRRRLNVAATRAKLSFLVLGNFSLLVKNELWKDLIDYAKSDGDFIRVTAQDTMQCDVLKLL